MSSALLGTKIGLGKIVVSTIDVTAARGCKPLIPTVSELPILERSA